MRHTSQTGNITVERPRLTTWERGGKGIPQHTTAPERPSPSLPVPPLLAGGVVVVTNPRVRGGRGPQPDALDPLDGAPLDPRLRPGHGSWLDDPHEVAALLEAGDRLVGAAADDVRTGHPGIAAVDADMDFGLISGPELNFWAGVAGRWVWPGISGAIELLISPERQAELQDPGRRASRNADADCILTPFACGVGCGVEVGGYRLSWTRPAWRRAVARGRSPSRGTSPVRS